MGYWENTTYIHHGDVAAVARAIEQVLAAEGMLPVPAPPPRTRGVFEPMQYDVALDNDLWALAVFPGAEGWCVVKTAPLELLSQRAAGSPRMRLADVCIALGASAFQANLYDGATVLAEVSAQGEVMISGFNGQSDDPMDWHGIEVEEERIEPAFELHDLAHLAPDGRGDLFAAATAREIGGANAAHCDNRTCVVTLICNEPLAIDGGRSAYYRWQGPSRQKNQPRASWR